MRVLVIFALVEILYLSRLYLARFQVPRSFYDIISFLLPAALVLFFFISPRFLPFEQKIERDVIRVGKRWAPLLLDTLVVILAVVFIYRVTHYIFTEPISCLIADMLPIIRGAGERLVSFQNPFNMTFCPTYGGPFPYLPMMMVYYLPGVIFRMDIRIVSLLFCLGLLLMGYVYYRKRGYYLTGFLIFAVLTISVLLPLFLITVHTFPYLFVLAVLLLALNEDNDKVMFFSLALAMASRKFFWLYLPFFVIYIFKIRKFSLSSIKYFVFGCILGLVPYILFPGDFVRSNILHVANANIDAIPDLHLQHSIGLTPFSFHHRTLFLIILVVLYGLTCILALKYLDKKNAWAFLSLSTLIFLYFQVSTRTQEYYFLPLITFLLFAPLEELKVKYERKKIFYLGFPIVVSFVLILAFFPKLSGTQLPINPIQGHTAVLPNGYIQSSGYLELSLGRNFGFDEALILQIRRKNFQENKPVQIAITINDKDYWDGIYQRRRIEIPLDKSDLKNKFYFGGNSIKISLVEPEDFIVKIRRRQ